MVMAANPISLEAAEPLLSVQGLVKYFALRGGFLQRATNYVKAVDGISFDVRPGETFGLVGESGCGKTTVGRCILRLVARDEGKVIFEGRDVYELNNREMTAVRKDMQIIFQDPYSSC